MTKSPGFWPRAHADIDGVLLLIYNLQETSSTKLNKGVIVHDSKGVFLLLTVFFFFFFVILVKTLSWGFDIKQIKIS
jgi:hypothetical protein